MILTAFVKRQLGMFCILTAIALGLMVFVYARIPADLGIGVYSVKAEFDDASGLYPKALVTFHGVKVGQVTSVSLTPTMAVATFRLDDGTSIPANVDAELHSTSAIGEQYVDLVPKGTPTGTLTGGTTLGLSRTVPMPQISPVLNSLNHLLQSVPLNATTNVLNQINTGLGSQGRQVNQLIDSSSKLVASAQQQISATANLISVLQPVLTQQIRLAPFTVSYMSSLNAFTKELAAKDVDLRSLLNHGPTGLAQVTTTVRDLQQSLPSLLRNMGVTGSVLKTYLPNLQQTLAVYPATVAALQSAVNPRASQGDVQLDLRAGVNDPPSCITGYLPVNDRRSPSISSVRSVNLGMHCTAAPDNPSGVRGDRNLPCPNSAARGPVPASCGLVFGKGVTPTSAQGSAASTGSTASTVAGSTDAAGATKSTKSPTTNASVTVADRLMGGNLSWVIVLLGGVLIGAAGFRLRGTRIDRGHDR